VICIVTGPRAPVVLGANRTVIVVLPFAAREVAGELVIVKSPATVAAMLLNVALPVLRKVKMVSEVCPGKVPGNDTEPPSLIVVPTGYSMTKSATLKLEKATCSS
jgi:hypothetical protein